MEFMKSLTVRLPEPLVADIEAESRGRKSRSPMWFASASSAVPVSAAERHPSMLSPISSDPWMACRPI